MEILSHRGFWTSSKEKNTLPAFCRAAACGFGAELDIRDSLGKIVVSHDPPQGSEVLFEAVLQIFSGTNLPLAINVKADGLAENCRELLKRYELENWFLFDMSVPDLRAHIQAGNRVFSRLSDLESEPVLLTHSEGVWLDSFNSDWFGSLEISRILSLGKSVCVVSPELHGRSHEQVWALLGDFPSESRLMLCTDFPDSAQKFFREKR